jgi:DNA-binding CsgD family transcriptional regulator
MTPLSFCQTRHNIFVLGDFMTTSQKNIVKNMRACGESYTAIAELLGLSKNTVKSFCKRNNLYQTVREKTSGYTFCKNCGKEIFLIAKRKPKKFCTDTCRTTWWAMHPQQLNKKAVYDFTCTNCGEKFTAYGNNARKFCSHSCYVAYRFG